MVEAEGITERPSVAGRRRAEEIRAFILAHLTEDDFSDVVSLVRDAFPVSRQVIHKQVKRLEAAGLIEGKGLTKRRVHRLAVTKTTTHRQVRSLQEYEFWREFAEPRVRDLPRNVVDIVHFGFTEMVNNVIDHSESEQVLVEIERTAKAVHIYVADFGVGIFKKIKEALQLPNPQEAIFELTKGKFTTDPSKHSGEGIFFTTRMFDEFRLLSGGLFLSHTRAENDWLLGSEDGKRTGTSVSMSIASDSKCTMNEVYEYYSVVREDYAFNKTNVVLRLLEVGDDSFISRSQAKRVLARLPRFKEVLLDFEGVRIIAPTFADEIFRVFATEHPEVRLTPVRANEDVMRVIARVKAESSEEKSTDG